MADGDTRPDLPPAVADSLVSPNGNPNSPSSYVASPNVGAIAPVIAQITGGNVGNTVAGIDGAVKADNSFFGNVGSLVSDATAKISAAFNAGVAQGGSPSAINAAVDKLAQQKANFIMQSGEAGANIAAAGQVQRQAAALATANDAVRLGLDPNSPESIAGMESVRRNAADTFKYNNDLANMRNVGFFDNPVSYLMNQIINVPIAESRRDDALKATTTSAEAIADQTRSLQNRSIADTALHSTDAAIKVEDVYKQALGAASAAAIEPLIQAQQIHISAYELGVAQENAATSRGNLAIAQAKLPGELLNQANQAAWYDASKKSIIEQQDARAQDLLSAMKKRDAEIAGNQANLAAVNGVYKYFGQEGNLKDLGILKDKNKSALFEMATNLQTSGSIANSPSRALELVRESGIGLDKIPGGQLPVLRNLDTLYQSSLDKALQVNPGETKPTGEALQDRIKGFMNHAIMDEQRSGFSATNKFFTIPSANTLVDRPWAEKNPIIQALRPLTKDGSNQSLRRDVDGSLLLNTAVGLVKDGKLSESQAVQALRDTGLNILNDMQTAGGWKRFAIPTQEMFPINYQKTGFSIGNSTNKVDFLDGAKTLSAIRGQLGGLKSQELMGSLGAEGVLH